ncbi:MAG: Crp/Fnr family transcriptional regulator, partial [Smithella sp.]
MNIIKTIAAIPLFEGLPVNYCASLASIAIKKKFSRGQMFFLEGDEGSGFYIILSGKVKIFKLSADGKEQILHILED